MAIIKPVSSKASIGKAINYVRKEEKTEERLVSGKDCNPTTAIDEMKATKQQWRKTDGRQYKHYIQSFDKKDKLTPDKAHQIGHEWAEKNFKGYEVLIATHKDKDHIHNHFIVNSVSYENGKKFQDGPKDKARMRESNDKICKREGLSVIKSKENEITTHNINKYKALERAITKEGNYKSYVLDCYKAVSEVKEQAINREDFVAKMKDKGYETNWSNNRKHITFTDQNDKKVRNSNLEKTFKEPFGKEDLERGFKINYERTRIINKAREQLRTVGTENVDKGASRENTESVISKFRDTSRKAEASVRTDEVARANRVAREQSVDSERNRAEKQKTTGRNSKGFSHDR